MKLLFWRPEDIRDTYGKLTFTANSLSHIGDVRGLPPLMIRCVVPNDDGSFEVFGFSSKVDDSFRLYRARTQDGFNYENCRVVYKSPPGRWLGHSGIVRNENDGSLLCLTWARGEIGHALWALGSGDGETWERLADHPVYQDHDSFGLLWDPKNERFIVHQATYQRWEKRYPDNIGEHFRRVMHIRTSADGVTWDPPDDVGMREGVQMPDESLITPDEHDPGEMEFYRFQPFPCNGRYIGMMLNYAPSPQAGNRRYPITPHGPQLSTEWWISDDAMTWQRPFRDVFASGESSSIINQQPINTLGRHLWIMGDGIYGLPEDRIIGVGSMANAEFTTMSFEMPKTTLQLNASLGFHNWEGRGLAGQGYIMAELLGEDGALIPGFEKEKCVISSTDTKTQPLRWRESDSRELAGQRVELRFYLRDARIYTVTPGPR